MVAPSSLLGSSGTLVLVEVSDVTILAISMSISKRSHIACPFQRATYTVFFILYFHVTIESMSHVFLLPLSGFHLQFQGSL